MLQPFWSEGECNLLLHQETPSLEQKAPLKPQFDFLLFGQQSNHGPFIHANSAKFNAQCLLPWIWTTETNHRECCWETARGVFTVRQPECLQQSTPSAWSTVRKQINVLWMLDCQTVPRHGMQTNRCPPPLVYIYSTIRWLHILHVLHWKNSSNGEMKSSKSVLL